MAYVCPILFLGAFQQVVSSLSIGEVHIMLDTWQWMEEFPNFEYCFFQVSSTVDCIGDGGIPVTLLPRIIS